VNALSEELIWNLARRGDLGADLLQGANPTSKMKKVGAFEAARDEVHFLPDRSIFTGTVEYNYDTLAQRLRELGVPEQGLLITANRRALDRREERRGQARRL